MPNYYISLTSPLLFSSLVGPYDTIAIDWEKGPVRWMASESLASPHVFSRATDVWSYGATVHEVYSMGKKPYHHIQRLEEVREAVCHGLVMEVPERLPLNLRTMYTKCFAPNPDNRPTMTDLLNKLESECSV